MPQLTVDKLRLAEDNDRVDVSKLVSVAPIDREAGYDEVKALVSTIEDADYRAVCEEMLRRHEAAFRTIPAAKSVHHGFVGGLLEHTLSVVKMCDYFSKQYPALNRDLLLTAAMFHDIGKTKELSTFPENDYTDEGQLLGHIVIGVEMIGDAVRNIPDFPEKLANELKHCIVAHHGELEYGSPKKPALAEAMALNLSLIHI